MKKTVSRLFDRRSFLRRTASTGAAVAAGTFVTRHDLEGAMQNVTTASNPSQLKITDIRMATLRGSSVQVANPQALHQPRVGRSW